MVDDERDDSGEGGDEEKAPLTPVQLFQRRLWIHMAACVGLLLLQFALFAGTVVVISNGMQGANKLVDDSLPQRLITVDAAITSAMTTAKSGYAELHAKMEDKSIFEVTSLYNSVYALALGNEKNYAQLLGNYESIMYGLAAHVPGSGVWWEFYQRDIHYQVLRSQDRVERLQAFADEKPVVMEQ